MFDIPYLEGVHVSQSVLNMAVHHQFCQAQNLST